MIELALNFNPSYVWCPTIDMNIFWLASLSNFPIGAESSETDISSQNTFSLSDETSDNMTFYRAYSRCYIERPSRNI